MRINFSSNSTRKSFLKWVDLLIVEFAKANDIKMGTILKQYCSTPTGAKTLANWANQEGYLITFWCIPALKQSGSTTFIGFGIDVDETCPKVTELKLKV